MRKHLPVTVWLMVFIGFIVVVHHDIPVGRVAAGIFLFAVLLLSVVEIGWLGGNKDKASHM